MTSPIKVWRKRKEVARLLGRRGKILTFSVVHTAPTGFERLAPYVVAIVQLSSGERVTGQIVDWEEGEIKIGSRVEAVFRRLYEPSPEGVIEYGIKFRLLGEDRRRKTEDG